ncbi:MAG: nucleotidyl transferase, partial [Chloroflexota bacterium]|nr:nucleotidyl transferase [Chloroflexota bacterium]
YEAAFEQLANIVSALNFDLGAMLDVSGERMHLVDGTGAQVPQMKAVAAMTRLVFTQHPGATVAVPVDAPSVFETLAAAHGGTILRTRLDSQSLMVAAQKDDVRLGGDGRGRIIFPDFHSTFDGMFGLVKLLELLSRERTTLHEVVADLPVWHIKETDVACPWDKKGRVMRLLGEQYRERRVRTLDGIKIQLGEDWVLILPDPDEPQFHLVAEAQSDDEAEVLVNKYAEIVTGLRQ